jgi:predicted nucleic acid-binding protein
MDINNQQEQELQQELQQEALQEELQQERQALNLELQQLHRSLIQISKAIRQHRSLEDNLQEEQFEERGEELQARLKTEAD